MAKIAFLLTSNLPRTRGAVNGAAVAAIESAGQPVVRIVLNDLYELGQVFFQWEIATAVAGSVIGIDAFNQPDVEASKIVTRDLTDAFEKEGSLPDEKPILDQDGIKLFTDPANAAAADKDAHPTLGSIIRSHIDRIQAGRLFRIAGLHSRCFRSTKTNCRRSASRSWKQASGDGARFWAAFPAQHRPSLQRRTELRRVPADHLRRSDDLQVPGQKYTFGVVKAAQARGDFHVLADRKRRALARSSGKEYRGGS